MLKEIIVVGLIFTGIIGFFMSLLIVNAIDKFKGIARIIITVVLAVVIGFGIGGLFVINNHKKDMEYNNGNCACGGHYELFDIERSNFGIKHYYYKCDECSKLFER